MTDGASIAGAVQSARIAFDLVKTIYDSSASLERAEMRLRLAEVIGALADVKIQIAEVQGHLGQKDGRIRELEEALEVKVTLRRVNDAYYKVGADGEPHGQSFCSRCWDVEHRLRALVRSTQSGRNNICPACNALYLEGYSSSKPD